MFYLSFNIIFFLLLAALLGIFIGWLLRGSKFQTELQDLDSRWRTKLGEVEGERDRFVTELTQANEAKAKSEANVKRLSETHESSLQKLKREHQTKIAAFADTEKVTAGLKSDLAAKGDELGKVLAELTKARQSDGDAARLGKELAAASEWAATLESTLKDARTAQANCKSEVDRLKAEIAELRRSSGSASAGTASSGGAMGLMSTATGGGGTADSGSIGGSAGGVGSAGAGGAGSAGGVGTAGSGSTAGSTGGGGTAGSGSTAGSSGSAGGAGAPSYTQRAASPSYLADAGGRGFGGSGGPSDAGGDNEGVQPVALSAARGGRADDLKRISGVGPKLEKTLNSLGIFHFSQIAEFTPDNVAWVDRHLRFKGRIARENWIDQARALAAGGETEFSKRQ